MRNKDNELIAEAYQSIQDREYLEEFLGMDHVNALIHVFETDFPHYCHQLAQWVETEFFTLLGTAAATPALGYLLKFMNAKFNEQVKKNQRIFEALLADDVRAKVKTFDELKKTNPREAAKLEFSMRQSARDTLYKYLTTGKNAIALKNSKLTHLIGEFCTSLAGTFAGVIFIAALLQILHINAFPIFQTLG